MIPKYCVKCGRLVFKFYRDDITGFVLCSDCFFGDDDFDDDDDEFGEDEEED